MSHYLQELIREMKLYEPDISHTYKAYLKLEIEKELNPNFELVSLYNLNNQLSDIFKSHVSSGKIIYVIDMGEGFNYKIVAIEHKGFTLIFACTFFHIIFLNYFPINVNFPQNERVCLHEMHHDLDNTLVSSFNHEGFEYQILNNHEAFIDYCRSENSDLVVDENASFWNDVKSYLSSNPRLGEYNYLQLGSIIIITNFKKIEPDIWSDTITTKLIHPTKIQRIQDQSILNSDKLIIKEIRVEIFDDINESQRCNSCGEFYSNESMVGQYCFRCSADIVSEGDTYDLI